jgi:serine/threonine protein kinase
MLKTNNNFYFVYEFCNGGTLEKLLKQEKKLPEAKAMQYFKQLVEAFKVLNKHNIMHRDLKPDNILFHNGVLKLGDFGFCKSPEKDMASTMLGSPIYMAPEVLKGEIYTSKADIWSLGVVLFEMLFGFCPFESNSIAKLISVLEQNELRIPLEANPISAQTQSLLKRLLTKDHFKRIDWQTVFNTVSSTEAAGYEEQNMLSVPDDRLRHSLGNLPEWDFQKDAMLKKAASVTPVTKEPPSPGLQGSGKINSATALEPLHTYENKDYKPSGFEGSPSKPSYYAADSSTLHSYFSETASPDSEQIASNKLQTEEHPVITQFLPSRYKNGNRLHPFLRQRLDGLQLLAPA